MSGHAVVSVQVGLFVLDRPPQLRTFRVFRQKYAAILLEIRKAGSLRLTGF